MYTIFKKQLQEKQFLPYSLKDTMNESMFITSLKEGDIVEVYMEKISANGSMPQIARVHAMIRELCNHTGHGFVEMKNMVKQRSGLCVEKDNDVYYRSFADCSREQLSLAIDACLELGELFECRMM
jgi:hypothetical protein